MFTIERDDYGHAQAIKEEDRVVLWLATGAERNEVEIERIVALLNQALNPQRKNEVKSFKTDKVEHIDHPEYGVGNIIKISKSGLRAYVVFRNYDQKKLTHSPRGYYTLEKLRPGSE